MSDSSWANVEDDLLFLLVERVVGVVSFIRLSAVCKTCSSVASATNCCNQIPLLMLTEDESSDVFSFYDHSIGEIYQFSTPQPFGKKIIGSIDGWLITASLGGNFQLLNPLNEIQIDLPSATAFPSLEQLYFPFTHTELRDFFMAKAICSLNSKGDYIVVAMHMGSECLMSSYCQSGCEEWVTFNLKMPTGISFIDGTFFLVTVLDEIYTINFTPKPNLVKIAKLPSDGVREGEYQGYVVECGDHLYFVGKCFCADVIYMKEFDVYEIDLENKKLNWTENIGNYALFVGINNAISIPITRCTTGIRKKCIYFTEDLIGSVYCRGDGGDMGVYDIEARKFPPQYERCDLNSIPIPVWVMLNLSI